MSPDWRANHVRVLFRLGYGALHFDRAVLERVYALALRYPVVFLPSHKSNLDHLVLQYALHENGLPPNHTAGGINMNFFPVGPLVRRSGVFFIRRTFKDNAPYKLVLRHYIDYLIEKRFPLEWYIEGGRSRSGKLLPPRFGLLAYVVDAYRRGKSEDVHLIPVSIAYDQIQDVSDYVAEQRGAAKQRESFGWFLNVVRRLRRRYGNIHIRFGTPLSLASTLWAPRPGADPNPDEQSLTLQKLAFEVCVRINRVTPITPTSLVTFALLSAADRALTLAETHAVVQDLVTAVQRRRLPTTTAIDLDQPADVEAALTALVESGVVKSFTEGPEAVYLIAPDQQLAAAYYRNTIIHFFLNGAIIELALLAVSEAANAPSGARSGAAPPGAYALFCQEASRLLDLFKFEFFFPDKETHRDELGAELSLQIAGWRERLEGEPQSAASMLRQIRPFTAYALLRPFAEAYRVVADVLLLQGEQPADDGALLKACLALGKQYHLRRRIRSAESVSRVLFETALKLARNRALLGTSTVEVMERRRAFAEELSTLVRRLDAPQRASRWSTNQKTVAAAACRGADSRRRLPPGAGAGLRAVSRPPCGYGRRGAGRCGALVAGARSVRFRYRLSRWLAGRRGGGLRGAVAARSAGGHRPAGTGDSPGVRGVGDAGPALRHRLVADAGRGHAE